MDCSSPTHIPLNLSPESMEVEASYQVATNEGRFGCQTVSTFETAETYLDYFDFDDEFMDCTSSTSLGSAGEAEAETAMDMDIDGSPTSSSTFSKMSLYFEAMSDSNDNSTVYDRNVKVQVQSTFQNWQCVRSTGQTAIQQEISVLEMSNETVIIEQHSMELTTKISTRLTTALKTLEAAKEELDCEIFEKAINQLSRICKKDRSALSHIKSAIFEYAALLAGDPNPEPDNTDYVKEKLEQYCKGMEKTEEYIDIFSINSFVRR